ncbi:hypothetical protein J31TS4_33960 [Paenibacillus sp. J31TS4]|uniref:M73 family metallopeptidase n=1 Tax=Paenibacillus sp. J31TS4 TaxID=2807195 RepID=UPI001B1863B9|nr:M73 family metallopeptidase [Paenibacillus sp. J31TS4]GIP40116.1 hypothetical protein J31TS4_33960 [Paenibacillus sp. J31TS4]
MNRKKLGMMVLSLSMTVVFTFGGATMALFTGSAQNSNTATAGTINLDAKRDHGDYTPGPMFYPDSLDPVGNHPYDTSKTNPSGESLGGWAPGDTVQRTMILTNNGSLDAKLKGVKATVRDSYTQNLPTNPASSRTVTGLTSGAAYDEFIQKANVKVMVPDTNTLLYNGSLSSLLVSGYAPLQNEPVLTGTRPPFAPGPLNVTFEVKLDQSASNEIQGKSFIFDFSFYSEQARNNGPANNNSVYRPATQIPFSFTDISQDGGTYIPNSNQDDTAFEINSPFAINFYGQSFDKLYVSTNGLITFNGPNSAFGNTPMAQAPDNSIAVFWDDLIRGSIYYKGYTVNANAADPYLAIQWSGYEHYPSSPSTVIFQTKLYKSGKIEMLYNDMTFGGPAGANNGSSATVGVRKDANTFQQYSYNQNVITSNSAIQFAY